uniref:Uncharacterized protein n=1 Tax=Globisporangium ultimum (strain ATCC 200006 / CBS 805.95 / DAOM BR144) TaxID=431595 RepID=K3WJG3_GLOUD
MVERRGSLKNRDAYLQHLADLQGNSFRRSISKQPYQEQKVGLSKEAKSAPVSANITNGSDIIETSSSAPKSKKKKKKKKKKRKKAKDTAGDNNSLQSAPVDRKRGEDKKNERRIPMDQLQQAFMRLNILTTESEQVGKDVEDANSKTRAEFDLGKTSSLTTLRKLKWYLEDIVYDRELLRRLDGLVGFPTYMLLMSGEEASAAFHRLASALKHVPECYHIMLYQGNLVFGSRHAEDIEKTLSKLFEAAKSEQVKMDSESWSLHQTQEVVIEGCRFSIDGVVLID